MPDRPPKIEPSQSPSLALQSARPETKPHVDKARKWMWMLLAALFAVQMYFVRELLAALLLFTIGFAVLSVVALGIYGLRRFWGRIFAWIRIAGVWALAKAEDLSRKLLRRPRSEPVQ